MLIKLFHFLVLLSFLLAGSVCADQYVTWKEEVKLNDGRIIIVEQRKRCEGASTGGGYASCIAREAWLTIDLPEFSPQSIVWHENLAPMVLNVTTGKLYVIGWPPTEREFHLYGSERPPYFGFVWENNRWKRIPFTEIPEAIYDANLIIGHIPKSGKDYVNLDEKLGGEMKGGNARRRIDPKFVSNLN
ncbi:hypothetical protein AAKU67_004383 [Oxalobacteraceae bacterium GrIS 2.11]